MKIPISSIKPNPFKKFINDGKLDKERVGKMEESIAHGTLPNYFSVRKAGAGYELCSGHHRLEGFKRKHGKDFKVEVGVVDFSDETMLVDMVRENLTQRDSDFQDTESSVVLARAWLGSKTSSVKQFNSRFKGKPGYKGMAGSEPLPDSCRSIALVLKKSGGGLHD